MKLNINKKYLLILLSFVIFLLALIVLLKSPEKTPAAEKGGLDLTNWNFAKDGVVKLDGEWEFYWNQLLTYDDFHGNDNNTKLSGYFNVPATWNKLIIDGNKLQGEGFATFRLRIKTNDADTLKGLKILTESTAYKIMIDNNIVATSGVVGTSPDSSVPEYRPQTVSFNNDSKDFELIVQISNYTYSRGGFWHSIHMGTDQQIQSMKENSARREMFLLGALLIILFYYAAIYWLQKRNRLSLYFVLAILVVAVRILFTGEYYITKIIPSIDFNWIIFIEYMTGYWGPTLWVLFIHSLYPKEYSKRVSRGTVYFASALTIVTIITPIHIYTSFRIIGEIVIVIIYLYSLYSVITAVRRKREGAILLFFSMLLALLTLLNDFLYYWNIINSLPGGIVGIVAFTVLFLHAYILAARFSKAFNEVEKLSDKMILLNKHKDEFLTNTSHELRTPVNSMVTITESVVNGADGKINSQQKKNLSLVVESGKRLSKLINDILDFTGMRSGELLLTKEYFKIESIVENLVKEFEFMAADKNIKIKTGITAELPGLYADKYRIIQVIYNLMGNAVKFTPVGGMITVNVYKEEGNICIAVRDSGIGIPEERLEDIFKSFEQVDASITRKYGGMGLGLSISKRIAETHGGDIKAYSKLNEGSEFVLCIPIIEIDDKKQMDNQQPVQINKIKVESTNSLEIKGEKNETIVVIDDNYGNIAGVAGILKTEGYSIKGFINPFEGLEEIFTNKNTALAIVDLMMPDISGYEISQKIRERHSLYELPVLILTARTQTDSIIRGFKEGANDILHKPFDTEELKARVNTLVKLKTTTETAISNEIAMLQAQINPHFLYNALNSIAAYSHVDGEKAAEAIITLSDYFVHSFSFDTNTKEILLGQEMELVKAYLSVEKLRFDDRLKFEIDIDDSIPVVIPPFTIQTLVENAVRHGVTKKEEGGLIKISGFKDGEDYRITIEDTGVGIRDEDLKNILSGKKADGNGVGLINIRRRLKRLYGTDIEFHSKYGSGTKITVTIKIEEESSYANGNVI